MPQNNLSYGIPINIIYYYILKNPMEGNKDCTKLKK